MKKQILNMESKIMKKYYEYMEDSKDLKVGVWEAEQLASICDISLSMLLYLGAMANAQKAPVQIKTGWYIYALEERILRGKTEYYLTIDNNLE